MAAREFYSAEQLGEITVTSNSVWGSACSLSPTLASGADYIVFWSLELSNQSNTTAAAQARVTVGGTALATMNAENRNTSEFPAYAGFFKVTGTGSPLTIALEVKAETNGNNIVARNRRLTVLRMGAGDVYTESTARQAVTAGGTTTFAEILSTSFTPDVGDYLVLGHSITDNYATTTSVYGRFVWDGTAEGTAEVAASGHADITAGQKNLIPLNKLRVFSEATGGVSRAVVWQGRSHQNGMEAGFAQNRLLILRLADFSASNSARLSEIGWVEGNVATDVLAISPTPTVTANPHLLLASWSSNNVSNSSGYVYSRLDDADDDADAASSAARVFNVADTRGQGAAFYGVRTYTAGTRPISLKLWGGGATEWSSAMGGSALTLLDLGADETSVPVTVSPSVGALVTTGFAPTVSGGSASSVTAGLGSVSITGFAPTASGGQSSSVTAAAGSLSLAGFAPSISAGTSSTVTPTAGSLTTNGYAPNVSAARSSTNFPATGSVAITGLTPSINAAQSSTSYPATGSLVLTGLLPTVLAAQAVTSAPATGSLIMSGFAPSLGAGQSVAITPAPASLTITGHAPVARSGATLTPAAQALSIQGLVPTVSGAQSMAVSVGLATISLTGRSPVASGAATTSPATASLSLSGLAGTIVAGATLEPALTAPLALSGHVPTPFAGVGLQTLSASLLISGFAPAVAAGGAVTVQPLTGTLELDGEIPTVTVKARIEVDAAAVILAGQSPIVSGAVKVTPANDNLDVIGFAPEVSASAISLPLPAALTLEPLTPIVSAGMLATADVVAMSLTGLQAEVRITSGRPTLTRDRTYMVPPDQTLCVVGRDQITHVVTKDVTTFKAA